MSTKNNVLISGAVPQVKSCRTLNQVYTAVGKVLETKANRVAYKFGLGPHAVAGKIKSHFGDAEQRVQQLELLLTTVSPKLKKWCLKLMKYTLPTESANTQCQGFKEIVDLATLFPDKSVGQHNITNAMSKLWNRVIGPPDQEWMFWQKLAATCLTDTTISAILERRSVSELTNCSQEGLSVIESLLVGQNCAGTLTDASALCIRYLAGVLDLPGFWQNFGSAHAQVADKLCSQMVQVLKDIGVDIPSLGPIEASEAPFDYNGVDFLATTLLNGLSNWFGKLDQKDWAMQPWPRAVELLPCSSTSATCSFEDVLPTICQDRVLNVNVMVDNQNTIPGDQATPAANHSTDNLSAHSINSDHDANQESSEEGIESLDDSQSQTSNLDSGELPLHVEESTGSEDLDFSEEDDTVSDITGYEEEFGMASEHGDVLEDLINGATGIPRISGTQSILASTPYVSPEAQRKDLEERKLILLNRQKDLGDNHPKTLDAMENLAWLHLATLRPWRLQIFQGEDDSRTLYTMRVLGGTHRALGQFQEAKELLELALEKQRKVLGENHPETAMILGTLALLYQDLGQLQKAQELAMSAVEKHTQLLGEDHLSTLLSMYTLAGIHLQLGQFTEAEDLYHIVVDKSIRILGENHPETLRAMEGLGSTCLASGQLKKAEGLLTRVLGEEHPDTLRTMGHLANTCNYLGQLSVAEELAIVALEKHQKVWGENHPNTLWIMGELASISQQQGRLERAEDLLVTVLEKRRKLFGDNTNTRWTMNELANL
ncbi:hypothetical protein B0H14DRAFT_3773251 [Mycena olivaceomarginata]|nr:hypothetical protein B0H14DRAFT_3773251 [Mycena olivaceomarginata]